MHDHDCASGACGSGGGAPAPFVPSERSEALALWLERLDLAGQLAAAGLPSFERDEAGVAVWTDPRTGAGLSEQQVVELDDLLHGEGDDPAHAVPVALVQLRHLARVRAELLESGWLDYAGLAARRGVSENAARFAAHKAAERGALLIVQHEGATLVPTFQLDDAGQVRGELGAVLEPLLSAGTDPWRAWGWLTRPAALLGGQVPHEAARDAEELPLVRHAAVLLAERARSSA